jgi:hypothetical protein
VKRAYDLLFMAIAAILTILALIWFYGCAHKPTPLEAELAYDAELLACTAQAKAADAGWKGSKRCEAEVDRRWGVEGGTK